MGVRGGGGSNDMKGDYFTKLVTDDLDAQRGRGKIIRWPGAQPGNILNFAHFNTWKENF